MKNQEEKKSLLGENKKQEEYGAVEENEEKVQKQEQSNEETKEQLLKDLNSSEGGKDWLVVLASFLCICVLDGTMYSFGVFMEPIMVEMKQSKGTVSIAGSLQVAMSAFLAPVAGYLVRKAGARKICMTGAVIASSGFMLASFGSNMVGIFGGLSLLAGTGFGLMYIPAVVIVAETFNKRRSFAVGLSLCGAGAGQVSMTPLVSWVVEGWGWRVGLQMLACISLGCVVLAMAMKRKKTAFTQEKTASDVNEGDLFETKRPWLSKILGKEIAGNDYVHVFLVMILADALAVMALYIPYSYLDPVVAAAGVPPQLASLLIAGIGIGSVAGRLLAGYLADQPWCHPLYLTRAVVCLACGLPFFLAWVDTFWMFICLAIMFGFLTGQWIAATSPLLVSMLGIKQLSQAFGLLTAVRGVASLVSPPMAGMLVDLTINPLLALYLSGWLLLGSGAAYSLAIWVLKRKNRRNVEYTQI